MLINLSFSVCVCNFCSQQNYYIIVHYDESYKRISEFHHQQIALVSFACLPALEFTVAVKQQVHSCNYFSPQLKV